MAEAVIAFQSEARPFLSRYQDFMLQGPSLYANLPDDQKAKVSLGRLEEYLGHMAKAIMQVLQEDGYEKWSDQETIEWYKDCLISKRESTLKWRHSLFTGTDLDTDKVTDPFVNVTNDLISLANRHIRELEKQGQQRQK
ncbi:MAG: hypothetical protein ACKVOE_04775 [Rickettsiales bacterium]